LDILATIRITSISNSALPIIKSHLDAVNMVHLLLGDYIISCQYLLRRLFTGILSLCQPVCWLCLSLWTARLSMPL
jgi:hypothetical protein